MENKKLKGIILAIVAFFIAIFAIPNMAKAATLSPSIYLGIKETRDDAKHTAFAIAQPGGGTELSQKTGSVLWKIVKYKTSSESTYDSQINFYCVKADVGFRDTSTKAEYNEKFDFVKDRDTIIQTATTHSDENLKSIVDKDVNTSHSDRDPYYAIIALSDLMYVKGTMNASGEPTTEGTSTETDKEKLLRAAGVYEISEDGQTNYLTDDMIEAIQQAAIWYFTQWNSPIYTKIYEQYQKDTNWFNFKNDDHQEDYTEISDYKPDGDREKAEQRAEQSYALYNYLVKTALANIPQYKTQGKQPKNKITLITNTSTGGNTQPVIVIEKKQEFDLALRKYITKVDNTVIEGSGTTRNPVITATDILTTGTAKYAHRKDPVTVKTGSIVTYKITIYNEGDLAGVATEITDLLPEGLSYVESSVKGNYTASYSAGTRKITFTRKNESSPLTAYQGGSSISSETIEFQCKVDAEPSKTKNQIFTNVAWISKAKNTEKGTEITQTGDDRDSLPSKEPTIGTQETYNGHTENKGDNNNETELADKDYFFKGQEDDDDFEKLKLPSCNFDLALRKYITQVNGHDVPNPRTPEITTGSIATTETATYNHRKDPVVVKKGDIVTYKITIYNEGDRAGVAKEVIDQLPSGLTFKELTGTSKTKYTADSSSLGSNKVKFTRNDTSDPLDPYVSGPTLDSETIEFTCTVTQTPSETTTYILTNVAWISEEINTTDGITVEKEGQDRDSLPSTEPTIGDQEKYNGHTNNKGDNNNETELADKDYFFKGQEDDDDFEKLKVLPYNFDLALRKYITQVNGRNVPNTRNPEISTDSIADTQTATYNHRKDPVLVEKDDVVTYNITIYNEGDRAGVAKEVIDQLPDGLTFKELIGTSKTKYTADSTSLGSNKVKFTRNDTSDPLDPYVSGPTLDSETIEFTCTVTKTPTAKTTYILTNVAWISKEINTTDDITIEREGQDRDSLPSTEPTIGTQETYNGHTSNKGDNNNETELADKNFFFKGQEDDDDFEKLKLLPYNFDLALRKYITKVGERTLTGTADTRNPDINEETIESDKTATYNHRKDPVTVSTGDIVTYNITVYNEGDRAGVPLEIVDQLPTGLEYKGMSAATAEKYTANYEKASNKVTFTRKNDSDPLDPYTGGDLDSETLEIECIVTQKPDPSDEKVLTNVAWISKEKNTTDNVEITSQPGEDRDSEPSDAPNPTQPQLPDYKGKSDNDEDLAQPDNFYKGQEDDDDFEKLKVLPKEFDLALKKSIVKVNDTTVPERIKEVDVEKLQKGTGEDAEYTMDKDPVAVKKGDIVKYRLRVYNEGELAGYAAEVSEDIPEGLEFIYSLKSENEIKQDGTLTDLEKEAILHNQLIWEIDEQDENEKVTMVKTNYLAKGEGAEKSQPQANLLKPFDKTKGYLDTDAEKNPDYRDLFIYMRVISDDVSGTVIRNEAAITADTDENGDDVTDRDSSPEEWAGKENGNYQDEEDYDNVVLQEFDLSLRKFIIAVSKDQTVEETEKLMDSADETKYAREPKVDTSALNTVVDGKKVTTATYEHTKEPLLVDKHDYIVYMLRIYNEGDIAGYATKITDYLPDGLDYVDCEYNRQYNWTYDAETRTVSTDYLAHSLINAPTEQQGTLKLNYVEVPIMCQLNDTVKANVAQTNIAEIAEDKDKDGKDVDDRDSKPDDLIEPEETDKPDYEDWQEDDDDFEKVLVRPFDLALRKFITKVEKDPVTSRIPQLTYDAENDHITYTHPKEEAPVSVVTGNTVEYTIRVFNEGARDGFAAQVLDDIPNGLEFLPENDTNKEYRWEMYRKLKDGETAQGETIVQDDQTYVKTENASEAEVIVTDYLSKEQGEARMKEDTSITENPALLSAFDPSKGITETNPDYADVVVAFKVVEPETSDRVVVNSAQISKDTDEDGKDIDDDDSEPGTWNDGEDDQDKEYVKVDYFDLALRKWVTQAIVIENGKQTVTQTGHTPDQDPEPIVKVDIDRKKLNNTTVKFKYSIRITNQGTIAGYAKEITDYVPEGLQFVAEDNPGWTDKGNNVITTNLLADRLLQPGESADVEVLLTWIKKESNMGLKTNTAEISEDYNDKGVPDIDSTPDNKKPGEDDIDDAPVMLSIKTGKAEVYYVLGLSILITIASGVVLIKKFVL